MGINKRKIQYGVRFQLEKNSKKFTFKKFQAKNFCHSNKSNTPFLVNFSLQHFFNFFNGFNILIVFQIYRRIKFSNHQQPGTAKLLLVKSLYPMFFLSC